MARMSWSRSALSLGRGHRAASALLGEGGIARKRIKQTGGKRSAERVERFKKIGQTEYPLGGNR